MIKYAIALLFSVSVLSAQESQNVTSTDVQVGDELKVGSPDSHSYKHIKFPRPNFIIKRGGIANYKLVVGEKVVVTSIKEKKDGTTQIKIKPTDGGRFFGSHWVVAADIDGALESGELQPL